MNRMHWLVAAGTLAVTGLTGCSTVSEKWQQFRGKGQDAVVQAAHAPRKLHATTETGRWVGLYHYTADSGVFQECETGQVVPVLLEGDNALLENAYLASRAGATAPMLATVDGRMVQRPSADIVLAKQGVTELAVRVERFVSLSSAANCSAGKAVAQGVSIPAQSPVVAAPKITSPAVNAETTPSEHTSTQAPLVQSAVAVPVQKAASQGQHAPGHAAVSAEPAAAASTDASSLQETYWKFVRIHGQEVKPVDREPHLILKAQAKLVGSGGCNHLLGDWHQDGAALQFEKVATTRKACQPAAMQLERAVLAALKSTHKWRVQGGALQLLDAQGTVLAVLQAVALR